jgi:hypothetical protein
VFNLARRNKKEVPAPAPEPENIISQTEPKVIQAEDLTLTMIENNEANVKEAVKQVHEEQKKAAEKGVVLMAANVLVETKPLEESTDKVNLAESYMTQDKSIMDKYGNAWPTFKKIAEWRDPIFDALVVIRDSPLKHPEIPVEAYIVIDNISNLTDMLRGKMDKDRENALYDIKYRVPGMYYNYMVKSTPKERAEKSKILIEKYGKKV